jgi:hypothetical protein
VGHSAFVQGNDRNLLNETQDLLDLGSQLCYFPAQRCDFCFERI